MDRFRTTFPISVTFGAGEQPSSTKLNGWAQQTQNGLKLVERALGDLWNQAADSNLSPSGIGDIDANANFIPNLARAIGSFHRASPRIPGVIDDTHTYTYVDIIGDRYAGENEGWLQFTPTGTPTGSGGAVTTLVGSRKLVIAAGDFWIDSDGHVFTFTIMAINETITYDLLESDIPKDMGDDTNLNVIPDPTLTGTVYGLRAEYQNGTDATNGYLITLPPRTPITGDVLAEFSNLYPETAGANTGTTDVSYWVTTSDASFPVAGTQRHILPKFLRDLADEASEQQVPDGFLYIWDREAGTILEGLTFYTLSTTHGAARHWELKVTSSSTTISAFDDYYTTDLIDQTDLAILRYKARFILISIGTGLSEAVYQLNKQMWSHSHQQNTGNALEHNDLTGLITPAGSTDYPSTTPPFPGTAWENDDHTMYLHRAGYSQSDPRDEYSNAMVGDLMISSTTAGAGGDYLHNLADSWSLRFAGLNGVRLSFDVDNVANTTIGDADSTLGDYTAGAFMIQKRTLWLYNRLKFEDTDLRITNLLFGGDGVASMGGIIRYDRSLAAFIFGYSNDATVQEPADLSLVAGQLLAANYNTVGLKLTDAASLTSGDLLGSSTLSEGAVAIVGTATGGDISLKYPDAAAGDQHILRLNSLATSKTTQTVIDGETDSCLHLRWNRLYFGDQSTNITNGERLEYDGSSRYTFKKDPTPTDIATSVGTILEVGLLDLSGASVPVIKTVDAGGTKPSADASDALTIDAQTLSLVTSKSSPSETYQIRMGSAADDAGTISYDTSAETFTLQGVGSTLLVDTIGDKDGSMSILGDVDIGDDATDAINIRGTIDLFGTTTLDTSLPRGTDNLGAPGTRWENIYGENGNFNTALVSLGTLNVTGTSTLQNDVTISAGKNILAAGASCDIGSGGTSFDKGYFNSVDCGTGLTSVDGDFTGDVSITGDLLLGAESKLYWAEGHYITDVDDDLRIVGEDSLQEYYDGGGNGTGWWQLTEGTPGAATGIRIRAKPGGNVAIGAHNPTTKLDVDGTFKASGASTLAGLVTASAGVAVTGGTLDVDGNTLLGTTPGTNTIIANANLTLNMSNSVVTIASDAVKIVNSNNGNQVEMDASYSLLEFTAASRLLIGGGDGGSGKDSIIQFYNTNGGSTLHNWFIGNDDDDDNFRIWDGSKAAATGLGEVFKIDLSGDTYLYNDVSVGGNYLYDSGKTTQDYYFSGSSIKATATAAVTSQTTGNIILAGNNNVAILSLRVPKTIPVSTITGVTVWSSTDDLTVALYRKDSSSSTGSGALGSNTSSSGTVTFSLTQNIAANYSYWLTFNSSAGAVTVYGGKITFTLGAPDVGPSNF